MKISANLLLILSTTFYSTISGAQQAQNEQRQLLASCQSLALQAEPASSNVCAFYIQGFLAGVRSTYTANALAPGDSHAQWSAFVERAYRTRVGSKSNSKQRADKKHFCLPEEESLAQVIHVLSKPLSYPAETIDELRTRFVQVLKAEYPCV